MYKDRPNRVLLIQAKQVFEPLQINKIYAIILLPCKLGPQHERREESIAKKTLAITALALAVAILGSFQLSAQAEDVRTISLTAQRSFAETAPSIPGYNAPYPALRASQAGNGAPAVVVAASPAPSGSFAATAPAIPGLNAGYPDLSRVVTQN